MMCGKRFVYGIIKGSRQAHIKDCHTCKSATIDVYDDNIKYFVDKLNEQQATNSALRTENNHLIDVIKEYAKKYEEQQATITELAKKWRVLSQENMQLKDYIDTIFEDNTHICKYLDVEDVQFYCDKNKNYRNPSCLYEKCFDEENLIKIKDEIRRVLE